MNARLRCSWAKVVLALALGLGAAAPRAEAGRRPRVLFFTKSSGYEHSVIKVKDGEPSHAEKILKALGERNGFDVVHSKDGGVFTPVKVAGYDALVFYTTGDLTQPGHDRQPPLPPGGKQLILDAVKQGKGFVGVHAATDTFLSGPDPFQANGADTDPFIVMLGGEFIKHGDEHSAKVRCSDPKFPGFAPVQDGFDLLEEWYSLKNLGKDLHVILWLATWSLPNTGKNSVYRRPPYPIAWSRMHGKGRVFYTALGHREDVWTNPAFQSMLTGGIRWATGLDGGSVKPNIASVTPGFADMPPTDTPERK